MLGLFVDIEATGLDFRYHDAIDIAILCVDLQSLEELESYQSLIAISEPAWERRDSRSMEVNGYSWSDLVQGKSRHQIALEIISLFGRHDVARSKAAFFCQNPAFDRAFFGTLVDLETQEQFHWPYHWLDLASMYWALQTLSWRHQGSCQPESFSLSKDDIARSYGVEPETYPHRALQGARHLLRCYRALVETEGDGAARVKVKEVSRGSFGRSGRS